MLLYVKSTSDIKTRDTSQCRCPAFNQLIGDFQHRDQLSLKSSPFLESQGENLCLARPQSPGVDYTGTFINDYLFRSILYKQKPLKKSFDFSAKLRNDSKAHRTGLHYALLKLLLLTPCSSIGELFILPTEPRV